MICVSGGPRVSRLRAASPMDSGSDTSSSSVESRSVCAAFSSSRSAGTAALRCVATTLAPLPSTCFTNSVPMPRDAPTTSTLLAAPMGFRGGCGSFATAVAARPNRLLLLLLLLLLQLLVYGRAHEAAAAPRDEGHHQAGRDVHRQFEERFTGSSDGQFLDALVTLGFSP